jgi:site-specific recombinase XerD
MSDTDLIGPWVRRFLVEHLVSERNLSLNTQASYRDTLVQLLPFVADRALVPIERLTSKHFTADAVRLFFSHVEGERQCSVSTRNQRLAALHALARFIGRKSPEHISWCGDICSVPFKKTAKPVMNYLEKHEMDALLNSPDRGSIQGARDYAMLLFLYNTGARADEAACRSLVKAIKPGIVRSGCSLPMCWNR